MYFCWCDEIYDYEYSNEIELQVPLKTPHLLLFDLTDASIRAGQRLEFIALKEICHLNDKTKECEFKYARH